MTLKRAVRTAQHDPHNLPRAVPGEADAVVVDTTWGELQPIEIAPGIRTLGELEVIELVEQGALLVDSRTSGSLSGTTLPGSVQIPHDEAVARRAELDPEGLAILFCNGPQCPQSPDALRKLVADGFPATALAYYRGGLHDWVTLALPTEAVPED